MIKRYEPWSILNELHNLLDTNFKRLPTDQPTLSDEKHCLPFADIKEEKDRFTIWLDLPGIEKKDISVSTENNTITIQGHRDHIKEEEKSNYLCIERFKGTIYKRFTLPNSADTKQITAKLSKGVLIINIAKKDISQPKKIAIDVEE